MIAAIGPLLWFVFIVSIAAAGVGLTLAAENRTPDTDPALPFPGARSSEEA